MRRGLQPYVPRAVTLCAQGCNPMCPGRQDGLDPLRPHVCRRRRARGGAPLPIRDAGGLPTSHFHLPLVCDVSHLLRLLRVDPYLPGDTYLPRAYLLTIVVLTYHGQTSLPWSCL